MASRILSVCLFVVLLNVVLTAPAEDNDAPDFDCPNENEYYEKCQLAVCYKFCKHLSIPPPCPSIAAGCKDPKCLCKDGYLRNDNGTCIPERQCEGFHIQD